MDVDVNPVVEAETSVADCDDVELEDVEVEEGGEGGEQLDEDESIGESGENVPENDDGDCDVPAVVPAPAVGMVFPTMEALDAYYRSYGKQEGFGVIRAGGSCYKGPNDVAKKPLRYCTWTCDRYGRPVKKRKSARKSVVTDACIEERSPVKASKKIGCSAKIYGSVNADNEWQIKKVVNEHKNHVPKPSNSKYITQYRKQGLTAHVKRKIKLAYASGLTVAQMRNLLLTERNGHENFGLTKRDIRNEVYEEKKLQLKDGDADAMVKFFRKMTKGNQKFFQAYRLDEKNQLQDILWIDARCRATYEEFGDVVCFDTTYLTNEYELPFANFVGVNHHGQSILLGCALISRETTETFEWVFSTWLDGMDNKAPGGILTDQSAAMRRALANVMPETRHRWCIWHITNKIGDKFGRRKDYDEFKEALLQAIYDSCTKAEFESNWAAFMEKYEVKEDTWLNGLYAEKEMWVPAFLKHMFWAGMKTTQCVESIHSFFDDYLKKHSRLYEFAPNYCKAMESRVEDEKQFDAYAESCVRRVEHGFPAEYLFQRCYTDLKFKEVQRECGRIVHLHLYDKVVISDSELEYWFEDAVYARNPHTRKEFRTQYKRNYCVRYESITKVAKCECCLFECTGIMCRHIIKLFAIIGVEEVPELYVLRRWRKDISRKHTKVKVAYHDQSKSEQVKGYDQLQLRYDPISYKAAAHKGTIDLVMELLDLMDIRVDEKRTMIEKEQAAHTPSSVGNANNAEDTLAADGGEEGNEVHIRDPPVRVYPHRTTSHRHYSAVEKAVKGKQKKGKQKDVGIDLEEQPGEKSSAPKKRAHKGKKQKTSDCEVPASEMVECNAALNLNDTSDTSCFQMLDPDGSVGRFQHFGGSQRVLFPERTMETEDTYMASRVDDFDTNLTLSFNG